MCDLKVLENLVEEHLGSDTVGKCWKIEYSTLEGRGIFATRDIQAGEIIFKDVPLTSGPRAGISAKLHCVICMKISELKACSKGCGLPICSIECEENFKHLKECAFIKNHGGNFDKICLELFRSLVPIRAMLMEEKQQQLLLNLAKHVHEKHGFEVSLIKSKIDISEDEEDTLRKICYVLDANAFEIVVDSKEGFDDFSLRGLYPTGALLNHNCVPNTTHLFDENQRMIIKTTVFIPRDTEILTSYTSLLWATASRRHHLWTTKHFLCSCQRCKDPKEMGACLSGLKCTNPSICEGVLYPLDSMDINSKWICDLCGFKVSRKSIALIQSTLGSMLCTFNKANTNDLIVLLKERIHTVLPLSNQIVAELKSRVIWLLGRTDTNLWNDVSHENLCFKEKICTDLLEVVEKLGAGQCKLKGLLLCELYCTLTEVHKRKMYIDDEVRNQDEVERQNTLREASEILYEDFRAPIEVKLYTDNYHPIL